MDERGYMITEEVWVEKEVEKEISAAPLRQPAPLRAPSAPAPKAPKMKVNPNAGRCVEEDAEDDAVAVKGKGKGKAKHSIALCYAMLCYAMLCCTMLCYATLRYAMPRPRPSPSPRGSAACPPSLARSEAKYWRGARPFGDVWHRGCLLRRRRRSSRRRRPASRRRRADSRYAIGGGLFV